MRLFGLRNAGPPNYSPHRFLDGRSKSCREAEAINRACVRLSLGTNLTRHDAIARIETTFPRVSHNGSKPERFVVISIPLSQVPWVGPYRHPFGATQFLIGRTGSTRSSNAQALPTIVGACLIRPTSPLPRERCAASFSTFCGISLSRPFCGT
jgi:hypothetical protein